MPEPEVQEPIVDEPAVDQEMPQDNPTADELPAEEELTEEPLTWQASEYVHHHKGARWYMGLFAIMAVLVAIAFIFKLWLSIGVFVAMGIAIMVYAHRPPRVLTYKLDAGGVTIENKHYPYTAFRSFGVVSDEDWHAIDLEPTQRFMPRLTLLFGDDDFEAITEHLMLHLPRTDRRPDLIERLSRYLRF